MSWPAAEGRHYTWPPRRWWYGDTGTGGTRPDIDRGHDEPQRGGLHRSQNKHQHRQLQQHRQHSGCLVRERLQAFRPPEGGRPAQPGPAGGRDGGPARPERRGQVHFPGHAARAAQAHRRADHDVRLRPLPRGEVRPGRRHAAVRRADARGDGARARDAGDQPAPQAGADRNHPQAGRHHAVRRSARGPAVRRPDPAGPVRAGHLRPGRADRAGRADRGHGRGNPAAVLGQHEGRGRRRGARCCSPRTTWRRPTRPRTGSWSSTGAGCWPTGRRPRSRPGPGPGGSRSGWTTSTSSSCSACPRW